MNKACFFDRDGVINEMVFDQESGSIHVPLKPDQLVLDYAISSTLKETKKLGFLNIIISNQPNIALKRMTMNNFNKIKETINKKLSLENIFFDKEYYCFHHPYSQIEEFKKICDCRKPKIGLFLKAAEESEIDLKKSWMIGDGIYDIIAGYNAGCKTILVANIYESGYLKIFEEKLGDIKPDFMVKNLYEACRLLKSKKV